MNGHLFGAGNDGAAKLRKQRQEDAQRSRGARAKRRQDDDTDRRNDEE